MLVAVPDDAVNPLPALCVRGVITCDNLLAVELYYVALGAGAAIMASDVIRLADTKRHTHKQKLITDSRPAGR